MFNFLRNEPPNADRCSSKVPMGEADIETEINRRCGIVISNVSQVNNGISFEVFDSLSSFVQSLSLAVVSSGSPAPGSKSNSLEVYKETVIKSNKRYNTYRFYRYPNLCHRISIEVVE